VCLGSREVKAVIGGNLGDDALHERAAFEVSHRPPTRQIVTRE
jgi:hypothetical protein